VATPGVVSHASRHIRVLPRTLGPHDMVDWIHVDILSRIVVEIAKHVIIQTALSDADCALVFNIANPERVPFGALLPYLTKITPHAVGCTEWVSSPAALCSGNPGNSRREVVGILRGRLHDRKSADYNSDSQYDSGKRDRPRPSGRQQTLVIALAGRLGPLDARGTSLTWRRKSSFWDHTLSPNSYAPGVAKRQRPSKLYC
jgi:hypothetical protein